MQRLIALECSHHSTFPFTRVANANFV